MMDGYEEGKKRDHERALPALVEKFGPDFAVAIEKELSKKWSNLPRFPGEYEMTKWWRNEGELKALSERLITAAKESGNSSIIRSFEDSVMSRNIGALRIAAERLDMGDSIETAHYFAYAPPDRVGYDEDGEATPLGRDHWID